MTESKRALSITFDKKGKFKVWDDKDKVKRLKTESTNIPHPSKIKNLTQITVFEMEGSHYYLLYINGRCVKIPIPDG